ncbi:MAG: 50S ribosomal protein L19e, partial [Euryarchaeota archaeon]|nr:50S ribosomal protein L19e [Euryarchaeota archaeon]
WIDPEAEEEVREAVTREDIRRLIREGVIQAKQKRGISSYRRKKQLQQKRKGRRRGHGSRKGSKYARLSKKERWMRNVRSLRRLLRELRDEKKLSRRNYRKLYLMVKGGAFRSRSHLKSYLSEMENR